MRIFLRYFPLRDVETSATAKTRQIVDRLLNHASDVLSLIDNLPKTAATQTARSQLARSVSSIGANYEEAQAAESKNDFVHKLQIALKEARESCYWLRLLDKSKAAPQGRIDKLIQESMEIRAIISKAVITTKARYR